MGYKELPKNKSFNDTFSTYIIAFCPNTGSWFVTNQRYFYYQYDKEFDTEKEGIQFFKENPDIFIKEELKLGKRSFILPASSKISPHDSLFLENTREFVTPKNTYICINDSILQYRYKQIDKKTFTINIGDGELTDAEEDAFFFHCEHHIDTGEYIFEAWYEDAHMEAEAPYHFLPDKEKSKIKFLMNSIEHHLNPYRYYEVRFEDNNGYYVGAICIFGETQPTIAEAKEFCKEDMKALGATKIVGIREISAKEAYTDFVIDGIEDDLPIFKRNPTEDPIQQIINNHAQKEDDFEIEEREWDE